MVRRGKRQNIRPNAFGVCFTFLLARNPKACMRKKKAEERKSVNRCVTCKRQRALQQNGGKDGASSSLKNKKYLCSTQCGG